MALDDESTAKTNTETSSVSAREEDSASDLTIDECLRVLRTHWKLVLLPPAALCLATALVCLLLPEKYAYHFLVRTARLTQTEFRVVPVESMANVQGWINFHFVDNPAIEDRATLQGVRSPRSSDLLIFEVWGDSLQSADEAFSRMFARLQAQYEPAVQAFVTMQKNALNDFEAELGRAKSGLAKLHGRNGTTGGAIDYLLFVERDRLRSHIENLLQKKRAIIFSTNPDNTSNFKLLDKKPASESPVFPRTSLYVVVVGVLSLLLFGAIAVRIRRRVARRSSEDQ